MTASGLLRASWSPASSGGSSAARSCQRGRSAIWDRSRNVIRVMPLLRRSRSATPHGQLPPPSGQHPHVPGKILAHRLDVTHALFILPQVFLGAAVSIPAPDLPRCWLRRGGEVPGRRAWSRVVVEPVTEPIARRATAILAEAGLHGHRHAIDAMLSATALAAPGPVTVLTSDPEDIATLCGRNVTVIKVLPGGPGR